MRAMYLVRTGDAAQAFELREAPTPEPGTGQVRVAVEGFGLNYADVSARQGLYQDAPPMPSVIGYEVVGRIDAVGADVQDLNVGQRVTALTRFGGYATHALTDARAVAPIAEDMDVGMAAALPTQGCTAYYMAEEMVRLHPGDHVLVHAAAGTSAAQLVCAERRIARTRAYGPSSVCLRPLFCSTSHFLSGSKYWSIARADRSSPVFCASIARQSTLAPGSRISRRNAPTSRRP